MNYHLRVAMFVLCAALGCGCEAAKTETMRAMNPEALPPLEGFYLAGFTSQISYMLIERDTTGTLQLKDPDYGSWIKQIERSDRGYVFLRCCDDVRWRNPQPRYSNRKTGKFDMAVIYEIAPSRTVRGDWDLVGLLDDMMGRGAFELQRPVASALHRMDDPRAREYVLETRAFWDKARPPRDQPAYPYPEPPPFPARLSRLAEAMLADHSDDPYYRLLYLDSLMGARDMKRLEECVERWRPQFAEPSLPRMGFRIAERTARSARLTAEGRNVFALGAEVTLGGCDLQGVLRKSGSLLNYEDLVTPSLTLIHDFGPNYLRMQISAKVLETASTFMLLLGRRAQALEYGAAIYHLGQMMDNDGTLIARLIGVALKEVGVRPLQMVALNAVEDASEGEVFWAMLERLNRWEKAPPDEDSLLWYDGAGAQLPKEQWGELRIAESVAEYQARRSVAATRFQLTRLAAAARQRMLLTGRPQAGGGELGPLLPDGPPPDPFTAAPLRLAPMPGGVRCYGVGPDKADDQGAITYDPSNGTVSRGDIILDAPRERKYPFPRGGVRARRREDLLRQFPNGLPSDLFADTRGKPLGVSEGFPVYVYSYGPDGDEQDRTAKRPQVLYDPTNGAFSSGDLFIRIPER